MSKTPYFPPPPDGWNDFISGKSAKRSLRDYFAGQALAAFVVHNGSDAEDIAQKVYEVADAMMKARE